MAGEKSGLVGRLLKKPRDRGGMRGAGQHRVRAPVMFSAAWEMVNIDNNLEMIGLKYDSVIKKH